MKKNISTILVLIMVLSLCACGSQPTTEPSPEPTAVATPKPTIAPTPTPTPEPEWEPGTVRAGIGVVHSALNRGDELSAVGQWGDYYIVSKGDHELLVEMQFLRLANEEAFEIRDAYSDSQTNVFSTASLNGEPVATLSTNTKLRVLDGKAGWLYVEWEEGNGYILADNANDSPVVHYYGGGGGGGGGADGGDIQLSYFYQEKPTLSLLSTYVGPEYSSFDACKATVLSDNTELYYCILAYGDIVRVADVGENYCTLFLGSDILVNVPRNMIFMDGDEIYGSWTGYTKSKSMIYEDFQMKKLLTETNVNNTVEVLDCIDDVCVVKFNDKICYMSFESLSETKIAQHYYDAGGGGGGEWTAPVM